MLFFIRLVLTMFHIAFASLFGIIYSLKRPCNPKNLYLPAHLLGYGVLKIWGINLNIINKERLQLKEPLIIISNHQHNLDAFVLGYIVPKNTVTLGKKEILFFPFFGLFYYLTGNILIKRKNKNQALKAMDDVSKQIVKNNASVWIMPEGTRDEGRLKPFKKGAFFIANQIKSSILPISISAYNDLKLNKFRSGTITIYIHSLVAHDPKLNVSALTKKCHTIIEDRVSKLNMKNDINFK